MSIRHPQSYVQATLVVDGALDDEQTFGEDESELLEVWLDNNKVLAIEHPEQRTEIYLLEHGHPPDMEECSCVQYLTDHHPFWAYGGDEVMSL